MPRFAAKRSSRVRNLRRSTRSLRCRAKGRNSASGTLRMLDSAIVASRRLDMFPYDALSGNQKMFANHSEVFEWCERNGFHVNPHRRLCRDFDEIVAFINEMETARDDLDYEIDGVVVKVNSTALQSLWRNDKGSALGDRVQISCTTG